MSMNKQRKYHSAMKKYGGIAKSTNEKWGQVKIAGNIIMQHDICLEDIPDEFYNADAVYSVMAWRAGYKHFTNGTIAEGTDFDMYCKGMSRCIAKLNKPTFVVSNRTFVNKLSPQRIEPIRFDRFNSDDVCAVWNYTGHIPKTTTELMEFIGRTYETVLDFCCGYGEITEYTLHAILSDINTGCLDYIKEVMTNGKTKQED